VLIQLRAFEYHRDDPLHRVVRTVPELRRALSWLAQQRSVTVDTETSGLAWYRDASICGVSMAAFREDGAVQSYYFPIRHQTGEAQLPPDVVLAGVRDILEDERIEKVWFNKKFDEHMFRREGVRMRGPMRDVMLEAHLYNENGPLALKDRAALDLGDPRAHAHERILGRSIARLAKESKCGVEDYKDRFGYARVSVPLAGVYACYDVEFTARLGQLYDRQGVRDFFRSTYSTELALIPVLCEMEEHGLPVNPDYLEWLAQETDEAMEKLRPRIREAAGGHELDPASDQEVIHYLTKVAGVTLVKETKAGVKDRWKARDEDREHVPKYAVDAEVLGQLAEHYPVCQLILDYREAAKLRGTYTTSILERTGYDGCVHGDFKQLGTNTGRLSSEKPNLQNFSSDSDERALAFSGKKVEDGGTDPWSVKRAFVNRAPGWGRLYNDYSQIELRVLAKYSMDPVMLETYLANEDIHSRTSLEVFGNKEKSQRRKAKIINFGLSYCMSPSGYTKQAKVDVAQGERDMARFFARYARIGPFREEFWAQCRGRNPPSFRNMFGRPRRIPLLNADDKWVRLRAERQAIGSLIQGTAAELTKESLVRIWTWEQTARTGMKLCSTIHDEISMDMEEKIMPDVVRALVPMMETFPQFDPIPILVDSEWSTTNWSEKKKLPKGLVRHVWEPANAAK